jgi:hypothetical protein
MNRDQWLRNSDRFDSLIEKSYDRLASEFQSLDPNLPKTREAIHLGHNWIICGKDKDKSRKAMFYRSRHHAYTTLIHALKDLDYAKYYCTKVPEFAKHNPGYIDRYKTAYIKARDSFEPYKATF